MSTHWLLLSAFAAVSICHVLCDTPADQDGRNEDSSSPLGALFGYRPCLDESCGGDAPTDPETSSAEAGDYEPQGPETDGEYMEENPRVHCIMLRPSAVNTFGVIESMHPGISDIKYRVLEELIDHMYPFATLKLEDCQPAMKLVDLIILAANSLKTQYVLQGGVNCTYMESTDKTGDYVPSDGVTEMPCKPSSTESSDYASGASTCSGSTAQPEARPSYEPQKPVEKPCVPGSTTEQPCYQPQKPTEKPIRCPDGVTTEQPCQSVVDSVTEEYSAVDEIEIIAEEEEAGFPIVGSMKGIPGEHYPNYSDIPITSFTCADKKYIPGFYADMDTGCQVFHVCYEHRRESFLCPIGTIFNQPILACDYWYSSNCSLASHYYDVNERTELKEEKIDEEVEDLLTLIAESEKSKEHDIEPSVESDLDKITPFFPVKAVVTDIKFEAEVPIQQTEAVDEVASEIVDEIAIKGTKIVSGASYVVKSIPEPIRQKPVLKPVESQFYPVFKKKPMKIEEILSQVVVPLAKAKLAAIPVSKLTALKAAVPAASFVAKTKLAVPVAAAKATLSAKVAVMPKFKVAVATPFFAKTKVVAAAPFFAKTKVVAAAVPAAKIAVAAPVIAKAKIAAVPAAKIAVAAPVIAKAKIAAVPGAKVAVAAPIIAKAKIAAVPAAKIAVAAPIFAKGKVAAVAAPIFAKGKVAAVAAPVIAKSKAAVIPAVKIAAAKAAVPVVAKVALKSSIPAFKAKMIGTNVALAKTKIPFMKAKFVKGAGTPFLKAKMLALPLAKSKLAGPIPLAKVKLAKAAAISPLTKKALALGYMKLLKAKKFALMG